jgi:HlyD family secretion protein
MNLARVELEASEEALRQSQAQVQVSREHLAKTTVRSPIDGTVTALNIKVGETAVPGTLGIQTAPLIAIADDASMLAEVSVDEADIASVAVGQQARVAPSATPDGQLVGNIQSISLSPKVAAQGRSYLVKVKLPGRHPDLRTGMTARVEITGGRGTVRPLEPLRALLSEAQAESGRETRRESGRDGGNAPSSYVLKVVDGVVRKATVETGMSDDRQQEILVGASEGDVIVVGPARALRDLRDGQRVNAQSVDDEHVSARTDRAPAAADHAASSARVRTGSRGECAS